MARKLEPRASAANDDSTPDGVESLAELQPNITTTIAGHEVTIREYGFFEGLEVAHHAAPLIADMRDLLEKNDFRYGSVRRLFGVHRAIVIPMVAKSADVDPEWVASLGADDAEILMSAWFGVNAGFFGREAVVDARDKLAVAAASQIASSGTAFSPASPPTGSAPSSSSESSRSVN